MNIIEMTKAPTPKFFKRLRRIGLIIFLVSAVILMVPIALPAFLVSLSGYTALAGVVISMVSQITVDHDALIDQAMLEAWKKDRNNLKKDVTK